MKTQVSLWFVGAILGAYVVGCEACHLYAGGGGSFASPFGGTISEDRAAGLWGAGSAILVALLGAFAPRMLPVLEKVLPGIRGVETLGTLQTDVKTIKEDVAAIKAKVLS